MAALPVPVECPDCGNRWEVPPKPDGSMPVTARCPRERGGCGKLRKVPRTAIRTAVTAPAAGPVPGSWEPPSEPRRPSPVGGPCPHCGEQQVHTDPRGITRYCAGCDTLVTPPGVLAPYERGAGVTRAAKSQRERDDDAKATVLIAGEFLRRVRAMLDDPKIHPASADLLAWYEEEISEARKARDGGRLSELADEFTADREKRAFRRRHWWEGDPAAITAGNDEDQADDEEDGDEDQDGEPPAVLATPASIAAQQHRAQPKPQPMTWAGGFALLGWRLSATIGGCQVVDEEGLHCRAPTSSHAVTDGRVPDGWLCGRHYAVLSAVISEHNRRTA